MTQSLSKNLLEHTTLSENIISIIDKYNKELPFLKELLITTKNISHNFFPNCNILHMFYYKWILQPGIKYRDYGLDKTYKNIRIATYNLFRNDKELSKRLFMDNNKGINLL